MSDGYCMQPPLRPRGEIPWADLLLVLGAYDITLHVRAPHGGVYVRSGFAGHYRLWSISDNGGELNVEMVNHDETYCAVPYQYRYGVVDAGTLAYRVAMCIKGEPVDWGMRCPDLVDECRQCRELPASPPAMPANGVE